MDLFDDTRSVAQNLEGQGKSHFSGDPHVDDQVDTPWRQQGQVIRRSAFQETDDDICCKVSLLLRHVSSDTREPFSAEFGMVEATGILCDLVQAMIRSKLRQMMQLFGK